MLNGIVFEQDAPVTDSEYLDLRAAVGWDSKCAALSLVAKKVFVQFSARHNGLLVGFVNVLSDGYDDAYIQNLMVHEEFQKQGIGTEWMKRTIRHIQKMNAKSIQITFSPNLEAFYSKFGFFIQKSGVIDKDTINVTV